MPLTIYNSLSRKKEAFEPIDPAKKRVTIYNCGPTVYDHFHVGNARNFVVMDVIRRYLERSYEVKFVQNLTDIDDKIINRAKEEGVAFNEIRQKYIASYFENAAKLRIRKADAHPCATEFIPQMIGLMKRLEAAGLAYVSDGSLYYRVRKFSEYGRLSGRSVDDLREGARVEVNEKKEDPLDFVLWKAAKPGEPKWPSPWGEGRPGWHIECSTMAMTLLGESIDIHSGGHDLMFPHHENEIAQSEGATGKPFVRFWLHNGFLNIESQKMSKSLGNILKIDQILARYSVPAVRFFLLSAHYRHPLDYSSGALEEATSAVRRINECFDTTAKILADQGYEIGDTDGKEFDQFQERFAQTMDDDFNTPQALASLHDLVTEIFKRLKERAPDYKGIAALLQGGLGLQKFFGLEPERDGGDEERLVNEIRGIYTDVTVEALNKHLDMPKVLDDPQSKDQLIRSLIECRKLARKQKFFDLADLIRKRLAEVGISLEDHPQGTIWKKIESAQTPMSG